MKTKLNPQSNQRGSVLVVSLVITFILGVTLASYLIMTRGHNLSVVRSQTWNSASRVHFFLSPHRRFSGGSVSVAPRLMLSSKRGFVSRDCHVKLKAKST